jgi:hypothetical protein
VFMQVMQTSSSLRHTGGQVCCHIVDFCHAGDQDENRSLTLPACLMSTCRSAAAAWRLVARLPAAPAWSAGHQADSNQDFKEAKFACLMSACLFVAAAAAAAAAAWFPGCQAYQ